MTAKLGSHQSTSEVRVCSSYGSLIRLLHTSDETNYGAKCVGDGKFFHSSLLFSESYLLDTEKQYLFTLNLILVTRIETPWDPIGNPLMPGATSRLKTSQTALVPEKSVYLGIDAGKLRLQENVLLRKLKY